MESVDAFRNKVEPAMGRYPYYAGGILVSSLRSGMESLMPVLVGSILEHFTVRLAAAERCNFLNEWEQRFVSDLREKFDERETQQDLGMTPWAPTRNQWATLTEIAQQAGCTM